MVLDEARAIKSMERGARIAELRAYLAAGDSQPLPESVEGFLTAVGKRGAACICKGTALLIECISPQIAELIAQNSQTGELCQRTGERWLVVPMDKEKAFRAALNAIGHGMPRFEVDDPVSALVGTRCVELGNSASLNLQLTMLPTLKYCESAVKHLVETPGKVRCQKSQHKIPVLLKQRIFMPVASVGPADQFGSLGSNAIAPTVG